jgi:hypothetical protein
MSESHVCRQCSADTHVTRLPHVEGSEQEVRVAIDGLSVYECERGHKRLLTPDFAIRFIEALLASDEVPPAKPATKKGLFKKHLHCADCGAELPEQGGQDEVGRSTVDLADAEPVQVEVHVPVYRCPSCQKASTLPEDMVHREVMSAVAAAFQTAGISPG